MGGGQASNNPWMKKIRLFSLKGGLELMNCDLMEGVNGQEYIFYSFGKYFDHFIPNFIILYLSLYIGEDFDYQVRMEFIKIRRELGEGGFGTVYLAHDELFN